MSTSRQDPPPRTNPRRAELRSRRARRIARRRRGEERQADRRLRRAPGRRPAQSLVADELGIGKAFMELAAKMLANPVRGSPRSQMNLWWDYMNLWQASMLKLLGGAAEPVAAPAQGRQALQARGLGASTSCSTTSSRATSSPRAGCTTTVGERRGPRRAHEEEGRLLHAPVHRRAGAVELRADQSRGVPRDDRDRRPEPRQGPATTCSTTSSAATASSRSR